MRIARIAWQGDEVDVEARDTAVAWSPFDLLSRKLIVQRARREAAVARLQEGADNRRRGCRRTLALPLEVDVRNIGVERLEWRTAEQKRLRHGHHVRLLRRRGSHAMRALRFVTDDGTIAGSAQMAANPPYDLRAALDFEGDGE